jgi:uncharacterized Zn-finger protein
MTSSDKLQKVKPINLDSMDSMIATQSIVIHDSTASTTTRTSTTASNLISASSPGNQFVLDEDSDAASSDQETATKDLTQVAKVHKNDLIRGLIDRKHQCKWCALRFYSKSQLKQHESTHENSALFCPVCDKEFTHKDRLSGHMKCHMEPSLECKVCGKKFKRLCNLYNHELVHGLTEHAFMLCQFCGRGFRSRRDYQNHVIANHRDLLMKTSEANAQTATTNLEITKSSGSKKSAKKNVAKKSKSKRPGEASAAERSSSPQFVHVIEDDDSQMDDESYYVE